MGVNDPPGEFLAWDSEFFGVRIGRVTAPRLDAEAFARVDEWRRSQTLDCIYCLVDPGDRVSIRTAEAQGFRLVDLRVDLRRPFAGAAPLAASPEPRPAAESDIPVLTSIARAAHRDSRFFFDERFDPARAEDLFATWIEKSCRGWADRVFVLESDDPCGYVTCHRTAEDGRIGLFAIAENARGRGYGGVLIAAAVDFLGGEGATVVRVATQGRNAAAQRTYQRAGFVTDSIRLWYHWWPGRAGDATSSEAPAGRSGE